MNYKISPLKPFGVLLEPTRRKTEVKDLDVGILRELFFREQLILLRRFETFKTSEEFSVYCERWGEISVWPFGKVLELIEQENPADHIFDNSYVPLHWDGMYRRQVPEYQIFHCVRAPLLGQGGRTTFSNTKLVLERSHPEQKEIWDRVTGIYKRKMEFYNSRTISSIVTEHPLRKFPVIRYNEPPTENGDRFVNPPDLEFRGVPVEELKNFHEQLHNALYDESVYYAHEWRQRDLVIADNFSLLHGREAFTTKSPRHLQRVQVFSDPPLENPGLESYQ